MKHKKLNKSHRVNQVKIAFTNKPITAWGGIGSLIAQFLERIEFRKWTESSIPIKETSNNSGGIYEKVLSLFLTVLVGGDRFSHLSWWGHGVQAIQAAFGVKWFPAATSTMTRFWGKVKEQSLANHLGDKARALAKMIVEWEGITEDNLNLDSTVLTRYGNQEGAKKGYNPKKRGRPSHHPILAFLGSGHVVNIWNRPGDTFSGHQAKEFFIQSLTNLGDNFKVRRVLCDSGFYNIDFIEYIESESYHYIMGVPIWQIFQRKIQRLKDWEQIEEGIDITEFKFEHIDNKWTFPRRYVVVRQEIEKRPKASGKQLSLFQEIEELKGYRYSLMITSDTELSPEDVWREYRPRASDENVIKDLKEGYGFGAFSLDSFWATEAVMIMNALVFHNLILYLKRNILNKSEKHLSQLKTIRSRYLIIPAQLGSSGGCHVLRLGVSNRSLRSKLIYFMERIKRIPYSLNCNAVEV